MADELATHPLTGVRVLDLSRILAGPVCTQLLADLGADVVKVERPGQGDDTRQWGPPFVETDGASAYFISANRGKRSLAIDLGRSQAGDVLDALLVRADVLVENFRTDSLEKLGLTPERLERINPTWSAARSQVSDGQAPCATHPATIWRFRPTVV